MTAQLVIVSQYVKTVVVGTNWSLEGSSTELVQVGDDRDHDTEGEWSAIHLQGGTLLSSYPGNKENSILDMDLCK